MFWGEINMETVQFLRDKTLPGWQMHYVNFAETDGEKHETIWIMRQRKDGVWRLDSTSTGGNISTSMQKFFVWVRDHPLISFSGGTRTDFTNDGTNEYGFVAHGDIIDNGFDVTRVRLVDHIGQVFEDKVQNSLVLFTNMSEREVQLPMQAELYNAKGELVWRQTVLDNRPPSWWKFRTP